MKRPTLQTLLYGHAVEQSRSFRILMWDIGYFCGAILFAPWVRFAKGFWAGIRE